MSRSTDPGHFFQTDASEAIRARRAAKSGNKNGDPTKLTSKILDVAVDPLSPTCLFVAESAGCLRKVNVESKDTKTVYRGPTAPLTSVAIGGHNAQTVFAGCWDKDIWSWDRETTVVGKKFKGHSDFVKTVVCVNISDKDCLISGGADKKIIVWDIATGQRLYTIRDKMDTLLAIQHLAVDPIDSTPDEIIFATSSSDPKIRRWRATLTEGEQILEDVDNNAAVVSKTEGINEHETSVYRLLFDSDYGDLWSASADGNAKCLSRARAWATEDTFEHGDYVRSVALTPDWVITAGRNEDVKVWDRDTGKLHHIYDGHFEEVTGLAIMKDGREVVSVSIDGTVRTWPLDKVSLQKAIKGKEEKDKGVVKEVEPVVAKDLMTADEEAELAELMDDSD
ncbi:hypothetical protein VC83_00775 [Pseudogymnoascus destructans]|uniref:Uncharacterized protein n=2 Tax=Pseudogymnoascus destructans TaxID=655981 RepID=L8G7E4_PSED2|nr:uncharacterized protein VC83_00775 [Pseudogymnoascus destructans]ELR08789.1 hypothetical protein GMDG_03465 [Pseudogymnoascus destructans 20631-21]OAF62380.1 hypothetical protein VC83_00775 [Pseudogymnoascus destructans]